MSSKYGAIFGAFVVVFSPLVLLLNVVATTVEPSLANPLALTENWLCRTPSYQKSKPMFVTGDASWSKVGPPRRVVRLDMSSSATPMWAEKTYVEAVIRSADSKPTGAVLDEYGNNSSSRSSSAFCSTELFTAASAMEARLP